MNESQMQKKYMGFAFHLYHIESNCPVKLTVEYIVQNLFLNQQNITNSDLVYVSFYEVRRRYQVREPREKKLSRSSRFHVTTT